MIYQSVKANNDNAMLYLFLIPCPICFSVFLRNRESIGWGVSEKENLFYHDIPVFEEKE